MHLGVIRSVLDLRDLNSAQRAAHSCDESLAQIVSERSLTFQLAHLDHDRFGLRLADPDWKQPLAFLLAENHDIGIIRAVETETHHFAFD